MDKPEFIYSIYIHATPESVWRALTEPEFTRDYWGGLSITSDWKAGSPVKHLRDDGAVGWQGEVLEAQPPYRLAYTFHMQISELHRADLPSVVTFEIEPMGSVVKLTIMHEHENPRSTTLETTSHGWPAILSSLKSLLESGKPLPFAGLGFGPGERQRR